MKVTVKKYDVRQKHVDDMEALHSQVACLYWKEHASLEEISEITGYAIPTVRVYVNRYSELVDNYDEFFNPNKPPRVRYVRTPLPYYEDGYIKKEISEDCGVYLVGSTHFDPLTGKRYFWIKVGMASNLRKRLNGYRSENPMLFIADLMEVDYADVYEIERSCHIMLSDVAKAQAKGTDEWFLVDRKTYMNICQQGFDFFFTKK